MAAQVALRRQQAQEEADAQKEVALRRQQAQEEVALRRQQAQEVALKRQQAQEGVVLRRQQAQEVEKNQGKCHPPTEPVPHHVSHSEQWEQPQLLGGTGRLLLWTGLVEYFVVQSIIINS